MMRYEIELWKLFILHDSFFTNALNTVLNINHIDQTVKFSDQSSVKISMNLLNRCVFVWCVCVVPDPPPFFSQSTTRFR